MSLSSSPPLPVDDLANVVCQGCGMYDATLRYSKHTRVILGRESTRIGIWCARCRGMEAMRAAAVSLLAGWWSPRGPARTIAAVRMNLQGGEQQPTTNAKMLRALALYEYERKSYDFAAMFAQAANATQPQRENARLLNDLNRAGYKSFESHSPWHFAAWGPVVVFAVVVLFLGVKGFKMMTAPKAQPAATPFRRAPFASASEPGQPAKAIWNPSASADELMKQLKPDSDEKLARAYVNARVREIRADLPGRIRGGNEINSLERAILDFRAYPAVAAYLDKPAPREAYAQLTADFATATRYYHGGADVESIERTSGETMKVTEELVAGAVDADDRGLSQRADNLGSQADQRMIQIEEMRRELRIRGAVIGMLTKSCDTFLRTAIR